MQSKLHGSEGDGSLVQNQQQFLPSLLRTLFRRPEFRTRAARMGKVARISTTTIEYWELPARRLHRDEWEP